MEKSFKESVLVPKEVFDNLTKRAGYKPKTQKKKKTPLKDERAPQTERLLTVKRKTKNDGQKSRPKKRRKEEIPDDLLSFPLTTQKTTRKKKTKKKLSRIPGVNREEKKPSRSTKEILKNYRKLATQKLGVAMPAPPRMIQQSLDVAKSRLDE